MNPVTLGDEDDKDMIVQEEGDKVWYWHDNILLLKLDLTGIFALFFLE